MPSAGDPERLYCIRWGGITHMERRGANMWEQDIIYCPRHRPVTKACLRMNSNVYVFSSSSKICKLIIQWQFLVQMRKHSFNFSDDSLTLNIRTFTLRISS